MSDSWQSDPPVLTLGDESGAVVNARVVSPTHFPLSENRSVSSPPVTDPIADPPIPELPPGFGQAAATVASTTAEIIEATVAVGQPERPARRRWYAWPFWLLGRLWDVMSLSVLLAVVAAAPVLQFASLGYILFAAGRLAGGAKWRTAFPGLRTAGKLGTFAMLAAISWVPIYLLTDLAYSAQLLQPNSGSARGWRIAAFAFAVAWVVHVGWAAMRGGRWWHFLWPAPIRFVTTIWRPSHWSASADRLYDLVVSLQFPKLWMLGAKASVGALLWICVPVSLMIIGQRAQQFDAAPLAGLLGAIAMMVVMMYLPLLQVHMAAKDRFMEVFNVWAIRQQFMRAPWFCTLAIFVLCALAIPLYLLRIEATPRELVWAPSLVFVALMLPAKLLIGAALGYANRREKLRHWALRWPAWLVAVASVMIYVGALYIAQFIAWQGAFVMYFQHALLVTAPLISA